MQPIRTEEIYDAALDDEAFGHLASRLADAVGARSGVLHWRDPASGSEEISYSGYFAADAMAAFERDFTDCDLWSEAVRGSAFVNRAWDCGELVPAALYGRSRIYNEWIRPMGDDTFHCLGASLRTSGMTAEIGFHRGRSQPAFGAEKVRWMNGTLGHLGKMIAIRNKLRAAERACAGAAAVLDMTIHAVFTLNMHGRLLNANAAGDAMLRMGDPLKLHGHSLAARSSRDQQALQRALALAGAANDSTASALLLHRAAGEPLELTVAAANKSGADRHIILVATDRARRDPSVPARLRTLYGLTQAEAEVAARLAEGASLESLAEERQAAISTVRTQLKAIATKMGCGRQAELVAMITSLPRLRADH
jgi:DNA-binding CsgD family transcriptional regulator